MVPETESHDPTPQMAGHHEGTGRYSIVVAVRGKKSTSRFNGRVMSRRT